MKAKLFKKLIAALPDDAEIMLETKPDEEWSMNPICAKSSDGMRVYGTRTFG